MLLKQMLPQANESIQIPSSAELTNKGKINFHPSENNI